MISFILLRLKPCFSGSFSARYSTKLKAMGGFVRFWSPSSTWYSIFLILFLLNSLKFLSFWQDIKGTKLTSLNMNINTFILASWWMWLNNFTRNSFKSKAGFFVFQPIVRQDRARRTISFRTRPSTTWLMNFKLINARFWKSNYYNIGDLIL